MDAVTRGLTIYVVLLIIFRISGKRTLAQTTPFDLVLTLIISEAIQQAMIDSDNSLTHGFLIVITLVSFDIFLSIAKHRSPWVARLLEGTELVLVEEGKQHRKYMDQERIDEEEILQSARGAFGVRTLDEVEYAVLEHSGQITIVPKRKS